MHFSIPDTQEFNNYNNGSSYTGFNIHINGSFHCCLRYKQLHSLNEQLKRSLSNLILPPFPSKKLLQLTSNQLEQRRNALERYLQLVGQDPVVSKCEFLRAFLLHAQQESSFVESREASVDVYLMNGFRIQVNCYSTECSSVVLEKACAHIDLAKQYTYYFALFLMRKENDGGVTLVRRLLDFEAPYISQRLFDNCKIVIRKNYWDPGYDLQLMQDSIALNLLYILTLSDCDRGWIICTATVKEQLAALKASGNKKEYLEVARNLPSYGCIKFSNAIVDYPSSDPRERAFIVIGNKELCIRTNLGSKIQETKFKVTRMRCWRVTTNYNNKEILPDCSSSTSNGDEQIDANNHHHHQHHHQNSAANVVHNMELSFEYLMSKNCLKWITIASEQAMLMSVCLQGMVDELLNQKDGTDLNNIQVHTSHQQSLPTYIRRDGKNRRISESSSTDTISSLTEGDVALQLHSEPMSMRKKLREKISTTVLFRSGKESVHNEAFEGIGDDDL